MYRRLVSNEDCGVEVFEKGIKSTPSYIHSFKTNKHESVDITTCKEVDR